MDWTEDMIARIRELWAEGHSTAEIGRSMGVTKNAIVGKAHRLGLPPRPSPIRTVTDGCARLARQKVSRPAAPARERAPASLPVAVPVSSADIPPGDRFAMAQRALPALPVRIGPQTECCWPIGEPRTQGFRYCDALSLPGRPYCQEHVDVAYVPVRDRREAVRLSA